MIAWNYLTQCVPKGHPDASNTTCLHSTDSFLPRYDALDRHYPRNWNATQQVEAVAAFGATYVILVVNQMTGFSLWDTKANNFSLAHTPFRGGGYDIMKEFADACRTFGVQPAIFYTGYNGIGPTPFGPRVLTTAEQDEFCVQQLNELAFGYGDIFELWYDGGIDANAYPKTANWTAVHGQAWMNHGSLAWMDGGQPQLMNPIRWAGDETCKALSPQWSATIPTRKNPRMDPQGTLFAPSAADCQMHKGRWWWPAHITNTTKIQTLGTDNFVNNYIGTTGRNSKFMLAITPTADGIVNGSDMERCYEYGKAMKCLFSDPRDVQNFTSPMTPVSGQAGLFYVQWRIPKLPNGTVIVIRENITGGQLVHSWSLYSSIDGRDGTWKEVNIDTLRSKGHIPEVPIAIGYKRILRRPGVTDGESVRFLKFVSNSTFAGLAPSLRDAVLYDWSNRSCTGARPIPPPTPPRPTPPPTPPRPTPPPALAIPGATPQLTAVHRPNLLPF